MGYDLHKYERFHTFNVVPAGATSELAVAVNKAGHIVQASEVRAEAIPYCGLQGSLDAIKSAYATYPIGTLASVRNSDNLYQKTAEGIWTQIAIPAKGGFTAITANGQAVSDTNLAILRWHYQVPLTYLNATNNGQDSNRFSAKYLGVDGVSEAINQFVSSTDNIYNNDVSSGYDVKITKGGTAMNKGESEANDQWMDSPYSGMILFMKQQATGSDIRMTCFEYVGKTVQEQLASIKVDTAGGIKGVTEGTGITVDSTTEGGLKPTVSVNTNVIATKQHVTDTINTLNSTQNGGSGVSVVQTNGVVATTVTPATITTNDNGSLSITNIDNVVTATGAMAIALKSAKEQINTELGTTGSIAQAIETARQDAITKAKVTVKTGTTTEEISELTLTDTSSSTDDIKISITPQSNTASDGKLNLKVSASTSTLAKKSDIFDNVEGKNTTVAAGTAPEVKVVLGGTVSSPELTVTATDIASASTLAALATTVNEHIAAKGGALTLQLADSLESIEKPSTEVIYLIPAADSKDSNVKDEYIYVGGKFEKIGSTAVSLAGYATEAFVTGITDNKADKSTTYTKTEVDTALGKKADQATTYTKTEVDTELGKKANSADVYTKTAADAQFAEAATTYTKTEVDTELGKKANSADVYTKTVADSTFAKAADTYTKSEVNTELAKKADATSVYTKEEANAELAKKADAATTYTKTEVDTELGKKADASTTYTKTEVDTALGKKANYTDVYTKTEVNTELGKKADASAVYTKTESDEKYALLSNTYTKGEMDTALADKATVASVQAAQTTANNALSGLAGKADKNAVVSSFNGAVGAVTLEGQESTGIKITTTGTAVSVGKQFIELNLEDIESINNTSIIPEWSSGGQDPIVIDNELIKKLTITRTYNKTEVLINVDLPNCEEINLMGTDLVGQGDHDGIGAGVQKISLPSLVKGTIYVANDESFMYLVDSLPEQKNNTNAKLDIYFCNEEKNGNTVIATRSLSQALQNELTSKWGTRWTLHNYTESYEVPF